MNLSSIITCVLGFDGASATEREEKYWVKERINAVNAIYTHCNRHQFKLHLQKPSNWFQDYEIVWALWIKCIISWKGRLTAMINFWSCEIITLTQ